MTVQTFYVSVACLLLSSVWQCTCNTCHADSEGHHCHKRQAAPTLLNRTHCDPGAQWPATRMNTTQRLADLREAMAAIPVDAFVIFSGDAHGSEYTGDKDKRRGFITGFSGSAGWAAVTMTKAALWTDGRYFLEAEDALDCNWIFMKQQEPGVPSMTEWLTEQLTSGQSVGIDPFLVTHGKWRDMEASFQKVNITLTTVDSNPVDTVWTNRPDPPKTPINAWDMKYAGRRWQDKISDVHTAMEEKGVHGATVVTSLDETAWLFNLRANDIEYNPFFLSYAIIEYYGNASADNRVRLYIYDKDTQLTRYPTDSETKDKLYVHLNTNQNGTCTGKTNMCVEVHEYNGSQVVADVAALTAASADSKVWISSFCSYAIFSAVPQAQVFLDAFYIAKNKTQKNAVEARGMEMCNNRDAAVQIEFFAMLEKEMSAGRNWTELSAAAELRRRRGEAQNNRGESFATIAGSGPNGAVIHYTPGPKTDRQLKPEEMFLLDSGGQYLECTTDTTRTFHFGTPTDYQIEAYTRVLMGSIDVAKMVFPEDRTGKEMDILARQPLWAAGLDYKHNTGHGVGAYLSVHDGPLYISGPSRADTPERFYPNVFLSDEPGFYEKDQFGIRLETVLVVEPFQTKHNFRGVQYYHFRPIALIPFEPKLIDYSLLSKDQMDWLNNYNELTRTTLEPLLTTNMATNWLLKRTQPYVTPTPDPAKPCPLGNLAPRPLPTLTSLVLGLAAVVVVPLLLTLLL